MPSNPVPPNQEVVVVVLSALVFGVSLCTFVNCIRWLLFADQGWKGKKHIHWAFVLVALIILALNTTWLAVQTRNLMDRVLFISRNPPPGSTYHTPGWIPVVQCAAVNFACLAADIVLIYRCWAVYEDSIKVIIFPILLWLGGIACTGLNMYLQIANISDINTSPWSWGPVNMSVGPGIALMPFWGSTLILNAYATIMLLRRLHRFVQRPGSSRQYLLSIMRILAESGILYLSITLAHFFVWFFDNGFAILMTGALNIPIIGIAFHLVIIRAAQNKLGRAEPTVGLISEIQFSPNNSAVDGYTTSAEESWK